MGMHIYQRVEMHVAAAAAIRADHTAAVAAAAAARL
jgi:hypothetical protein